MRGAGAPLPGRARITGLGIAARIETGGASALVGQRVADEHDLAELAQVYRNPQYETFRVFLVKGGVVVRATGLKRDDDAQLAIAQAAAEAGATRERWWSLLASATPR